MQQLLHTREIGIQPQHLKPMFNNLIAALAVTAFGLTAMPAKAGLNDTILEFCATVYFMNETQGVSGRPGTAMARHAASSTGQSDVTYRAAWKVAKNSGNYLCKKMY